MTVTSASTIEDCLDVEDGRGVCLTYIGTVVTVEEGVDSVDIALKLGGLRWQR